MKKIAYPGVAGSFSSMAARRLFPNEELLAYPTFSRVFAAVEGGEADAGVLPYENSSTGEVGEISELLKQGSVYVNKTLDLPVRHHLLGISGSTVSDLREVYSHPQALSQCAAFFEGKGIDLIPALNTAIAAKEVGQRKDPAKGAVASLETAELYGLSVLASDIQTSRTNTTRFIMISKEFTDSGNRFQVLFTVKNNPGELARVLTAIADRGFNMLNIKSHAVAGKPWSYYFHTEIEGDLHSAPAGEMILQIRNYCDDVKVLGGYFHEPLQNQD
ncbi:MAG: prephenate dehydratase [Fusobacteriaceae bacterium]|jgi:chorismate mutase/prephenate dehydratase|nr:prephenate dehydratase [Fusobacteriaceae bacterium]